MGSNQPWNVTALLKGGQFSRHAPHLLKLNTFGISRPLPPPSGDHTDLQWSCVAVSLPPTGLFDELAEELVLKLRVIQTNLQSTLGQRHVVVDSWGIDGHVDEKLTSLRRDDGLDVPVMTALAHSKH